MKKIILIGLGVFAITSCTSFISDDVIAGSRQVDDKSVTDEILCLSAFTSEVQIPKSKIQQNILNELNRRKITPEQCSSYVVSNAGGIESFCNDLNKGYVTGKIAMMPSFGNYITLQDMFSVQKVLGIDCKTKQHLDRYNKVREEEEKLRAIRAATPDEPVDFSKSWQMFQPKTNTVNCMSVGSSTMCNDTKGNLLNINRW